MRTNIAREPGEQIALLRAELARVTQERDEAYRVVDILAGPEGNKFEDLSAEEIAMAERVAKGVNALTSAPKEPTHA